MQLISIGDITIDERRQATRFLRGSGIEIGASHMPIEVDPNCCSVRYVDRLTTEELEERFPELRESKIVRTDVVCDIVADGLSPFQDKSLDFVIGSHLLEHVPNPLGFLREARRVLRDGGVLYLGIPDKDYTFDKDRQRTPLGHVVSDMQSNAMEPADEHLIDYLQNAAKIKIPDDPAERERVFQRELERSFHVHVWTWADVVELVRYMIANEGVCFDLLEAYLPKGIKNELILVLARTDVAPEIALQRFDSSLEVIVRREFAIDGMLQALRRMEGDRWSRLHTAWKWVRGRLRA